MVLSKKEKKTAGNAVKNRKYSCKYEMFTVVMFTDGNET